MDWLKANKHELEILIPVTQFMTVLYVEYQFQQMDAAELSDDIWYISVLYLA